MNIQKKLKLYCAITIGVAILVIKQFSDNSDVIHRYMNSADEPNVNERINDEQVANNGSTDLYAVINTPKMGTGGLTRTLSTGTGGCTQSESNDPLLMTFDCLHGHNVLRTHSFDIGSKAIERHRKNNSGGKCLIVTAIRNPATWFASFYAETLGNNLDDWPSKEALPSSFAEFLQKRVLVHISHAIPGLLDEFGGGSLQEQFEIMDSKGGYSLLGPAPPHSVVAGCNLLFLRMEQSDQWPAIFNKVDPTIGFVVGVSKLDLYPDLTERMKIIKDYDLSIEEKSNIYKSRDKFVRDWFDAYDYVTENTLNGEVQEEQTEKFKLK